MDQNKVPVRGDIHVIVVGNFFVYHKSCQSFHSVVHDAIMLLLKILQVIQG
jgi:hypothetical protein